MQKFSIRTKLKYTCFLYYKSYPFLFTKTMKLKPTIVTILKSKLTVVIVLKVIVVLF